MKRKLFPVSYTHLDVYKRQGTYIEEVWEKMGTADSHGCVRLTVPDAKWMWYNIAPGTVCVIRAGDPNDEKTASIREQLELAPLPSERPDIDPENIPSTDNWSVEDLSLIHILGYAYFIKLPTIIWIGNIDEYFQPIAVFKINR